MWAGGLWFQYAGVRERREASAVEEREKLEHRAEDGWRSVNAAGISEYEWCYTLEGAACYFHTHTHARVSKDQHPTSRKYNPSP